MSDQTKSIDEVAGFLRTGKSVLFVTGAGLSADSGMPTYRGVGGLYEDIEVEDGLPIEAILSGEMLERRPELTWRYLEQIAEACRGCTFNRGHEVIAAMETRLDRVWTLTQNVDGFHRAAGSTNVIDIHGDLRELMCTTCGWRHHADEVEELEIPPRCPSCDAIVRPDVVLFGEMLPMDKVARLEAELLRGYDVVFSVGTSSLFPYIVEPVLLAARVGRPTVEINPGRTSISGMVSVHLQMPAAAALDAVWSAM